VTYGSLGALGREPWMLVVLCGGCWPVRIGSLALTAMQSRSGWLSMLRVDQRGPAVDLESGWRSCHDGLGVDFGFGLEAK
jgi:hypothetical protein